MSKIAAFVIFLFMLVSIAGSEQVENPTCAVLTFEAQAGVTEGEAKLLSDRFAIELGRLGKFTMVNRSKIQELLAIQDFTATDYSSNSEVVIKAGRILAVQHIIHGSVGKIGSMYTLNTYLVNVENSVTEETATTDYAGSIENFLTQGMKENARILTGLQPAENPKTPPGILSRWMPLSEFQKEVDLQVKFNRYPSKLEGRNWMGQDQYRAIFNPFPSTPFWFDSRIGMDKKHFQEKDKKLKIQGYQRTSFHRFRNSTGETRYQATWVKKE